MSAARVTIPHVRALDGLRGVAVVGVLLYHGDRLTGGYLGVDLFFVLSGYLITSLLLAEWRSRSTISLLDFWARRARRLLPALALVLIGVVGYCLLFARSTELDRIRGDAVATIGYFANWRAIYAGQSYAELFSHPSPLQHTWSLAIEEQFYVLWPLLFIGIVALARRRTPYAVLATALVLGGASTGLMFLRYDVSRIDRLYYGTDTRAFALFAGIAIAAAVAIWGHARDPLVRGAIQATGLVAIVVLAVLWSRLDLQSPHLYRGGFTLAGVLAAVICLAATNPRRGPVGWLLSFPPLVWLGLISYGLYLWHWPVDIALDAERTGLTGWPLFLVRSAVAIGIAVLSFRFVEMPIRRQTFRFPRPAIAVPALTALLVAALLVGTAGAKTSNPAPDISRTMFGERRYPTLIIGDSLAASLRPGLTRAGVATNIWWSGGCPLIHGTFPYQPHFDTSCPWEQAFRNAAGGYRPRRVILFMGLVDLFSVRAERSGTVLTPGDPRWNVAFGAAYGRAIELLRAHGARVTVLTLPCTEDRGLRGDPGASEIRRVRAANKVIREVVESAGPGVRLADAFRRLCPGDRYTSRLEGVDARTADGVHFSRAGADLLARWLIRTAGLDPLRHS